MTYDSDGTVASIQALHNAAIAGDTITIPANSSPFVLASAISITKAIKFQGAGSGRVVARSTTSVLMGVGAKVFTLDVSSKLPIIEALKAALVPNAAIHIDRIGGAQSLGNPVAYARMTGTVTTLVGNTLTVNITSIEGSGTHPVWAISTAALTTIEKNNGNTALFEVTGNGYTNYSLEFEGIRFRWTAGGGAGTDDKMIQQNTSGGKPILIHDCYVEMPVGSCIFLYSFLISGVISNCSFLGRWWFNSSEPFIIKPSANDTWLSTSTMGSADTTGLNNFYIEDCDWHGVQTGTDFTDNVRAVVRWSLINNSGLGGHGADTSFWGMRHYEVYDSEFIFNGINNQTLNITFFIYWRGGTGLVADCIIPDINSSDYGNKTEILLQIQNLDRNAGPNGLWSDNDGQVPEYPCPRQIGMGRVTGSGVDGQGRSTDPNPGQGWAGTYVGDSEPIYVWDCSGGYGVGVNTGFEPPNNGDGVDPDLAQDYIQEGRDYFNGGTAKPGYAKFTYPHPLRSSVEGPLTAPIVTSQASLSGTAQDGEVLTADPGSASGNEAPTVSYQWYLCPP